MKCTKAFPVRPPHGGSQPAFTLIELLVVISLIALLMAVLLPTLSRVRKQARAVVCQSNLRQWGVLWAAYTAENHGLLPGWMPKTLGAGPMWWARRNPSSRKDRDPLVIAVCPMAAKPAHPDGPPPKHQPLGGTFLAWGRYPDSQDYGIEYGSYGANMWCRWYTYVPGGDTSLLWQHCNVRNAGSVPVLLDGFIDEGCIYEDWGPPQKEAIPTGGAVPPEVFSINRHEGGVNSLFLDWSVRKVGLKELWTLKWHRKFDTAGKWTKAGGAQPEDWPEWTRGFKDY